MRTTNILSAGVIGAASVLSAGAASAADDEIRIGALYATSGACLIFGELALKGHEILVDRINAEGGLNGKKLVTYHRDSKCNPGEATAAARDLIAKDGVHFLVGGISSSEGQAISEVAKQEGVIYIASIPKTTEMTDEEHFHQHVFRAAANTNTEGKSAAVIADKLGLDKICTMLLDYSYGYGLDEAFREHLAEIRPEAEIVEAAWPKFGTTDYTPFITKLMGADCDGVFSNIWGGIFPTFAKQAKPFGFFDRFQYISAGEVGAPVVAEQMGDDMPSGIWTNTYEAFYYSPNPEHEAFVAELREVLGTEHTPSWPSTGYIAAQWLAEAVKAAGTDETDAVIAALKGLTITTPIGEQTMRASDHQANRGQFWGQMGESTLEGYPYKMLKNIEYVPADGLMD
ncbi:ABC transporter substrate-binding protein [Hoeflea prorocentri]|uniref:ABC transporter substrate-binding protein n=1 Tax=Hoeflea prorocentri TaxID=1922333 RepID=A0A9X3UM16_9HYPH|nr:ABC transporter substrate-binding protein [Hoeflea prorocentri]MCY6383717.1 ABC transporter substrate-binding protein [Hoeflea prorocentri]MDA5401517.1 ABC transporter substrate-binding protein [Hoeflea prorocentri]